MKNFNLLLLCLLSLLAPGIYAQTFTGIDIWSGTGGSNPTGMTEFNGKIYFAATGDTTYGNELWVSDGTQAGTTLLKDIWPGPGGSFSSYFYVANGLLFFYADDSVHGYEPWVTDGTAAGTHIVADIWAGPGSSSYDRPLFTSFNGKLYFAADDSIHGEELWVSDGTTAGTSLVKDIWPGAGNAGLWGSGGAPTTGASFGFFFTVFNSKFYFEADDSIHGAELWASDGTTAGTNMVADIWPGPGSGEPYCITVLNNQLIMSAYDSLHGDELWISDGSTQAGTTLVKDIWAGPSGSDVSDYSGFTIFNGNVYFSAKDSLHGYEMWVSDGTTAGTSLVKDIWAGPGGSFAGFWGFIPYNDAMYFFASDTVNGSQLWTSDGTTAGTTLFKMMTTYPYYAQPYSDYHYFDIYNDKIIFVAQEDSTNLYQLYTSDGTVAGTKILSPAIAPNTNPLGAQEIFATAGGNLFFNANYNSIGDELWVYNTPTTGITAISGSTAISAWPNPFSTSVTISGLQGGQYCLQVLDMTGREYYSTQINDPAQSTSVAMPDLAAGVYLMRISGQGISQAFKLVRN
jgi:ELWxxDGT repeat protein